MKIEEVIKKSIEGGYTAYAINVAKNQVPIQDAVDAFFRDSTIEKAVLDPAFWVALSKSMGWKPIGFTDMEYFLEDPLVIKSIAEWEYQWHRMVDSLIEGKSIADFFSQF